MKNVLLKLVRRITKALYESRKDQVGSIDFETGKVIW